MAFFSLFSRATNDASSISAPARSSGRHAVEVLVGWALLDRLGERRLTEEQFVHRGDIGLAMIDTQRRARVALGIKGRSQGRVDRG